MDLDQCVESKVLLFKLKSKTLRAASGDCRVYETSVLEKTTSSKKKKKKMSTHKFYPMQIFLSRNSVTSHKTTVYNFSFFFCFTYVQIKQIKDMLINELLRGVICSHANDVAQGIISTTI